MMSLTVSFCFERLMTRFKLTEVQAVAILDMQLRRLAALERQKIEDEYKTLVELMQGLCALLSSPVAILKKIADEVSELQTTYGDKRKTKLIKGKVGELSEEDLIPNEETVITLTETGYIKRQRPDALRTQNRGGMGATGITTRDEDAVKSILTADTHDTLLFFTNFGRTFKLKVYEIQESSRQAKGTAVVNLINLRPDETVQSLLLLNEKEDAEKFITLATRNGLVKKTAVKLYENIRQNGIIAITLKDNDELVWGKITSGSDDLMLITRSGKSIRFSEKEVKSSARDTQGVKGIELKSDDRVIGVEAFAPSLAEKGGSKGQFHQLLIVTERGIGKRTELSQYPMQKRAGQGVKVAEVTEIGARTMLEESRGRRNMTERQRSIAEKIEEAFRDSIRDVLKAEGYAPLDIDALATEVSARVRGVANKVAVESAKKSRRTIKD
jgi:DNA gyrase subunit A